MNRSVTWLKREEIDPVKWDRLIDLAPNGLVYGYSYYLDCLAKNWGALVMGDYDLAMPLVWNRKAGLKYIYQPPFIQRLGIFGQGLTPAVAELFIREMARRFRFIDTAISAESVSHLREPFVPGLPESKIPEVSITGLRERINLILPLRDSLDSVRERYSAECRVNIHKAEQRGCVFARDVSIDQAVSLYQETYGHFSTHTGIREYDNFRSLGEKALTLGRAIPCGVRESGTGKLLFASLLFTCPKRVYYIMGAPTPPGRKARATYFFIDQVLKLFSGSGLIFDFEGSDIPSVAEFYRRFGPDVEKYYHLHLNCLPWPLKLLKR